MGKKKPLTKAAFENLFELLPTRGDSPRSWTIDFAARLQQALDEAKPFREKAAEFSAQAKALESGFREKRKAKGHTPEQLEKLEADWKAVEKQARENQSKAQEIEDAVFDLKAVNPNRVSEQDTRTPAELLDFIADKGKEADAALGRLRGLVAATPILSE